MPEVIHPYTGEPMTPEEMFAAYMLAQESDDATLRWLLDQLVKLRPELAPARDQAADEVVMRAARRLGRIEVRS